MTLSLEITVTVTVRVAGAIVVTGNGGIGHSCRGRLCSVLCPELQCADKPHPFGHCHASGTAAWSESGPGADFVTGKSAPDGPGDGGASPPPGNFEIAPGTAREVTGTVTVPSRSPAPGPVPGRPNRRGLPVDGDRATGSDRGVTVRALC